MLVSQITLSYFAAFRLSGLFSFFLFLFWEQQICLPQRRVFGTWGGCSQVLSQGQSHSSGPSAHRAEHWELLLPLCLLSPAPQTFPAQPRLQCKASPGSQLGPCSSPMLCPASGSLTSHYCSERVSMNYTEQVSAGALLILFGFLCSSKGFS